eukprot:1138807-Pelagomonas_calceolata.AAC.11
MKRRFIEHGFVACTKGSLSLVESEVIHFYAQNFPQGKMEQLDTLICKQNETIRLLLLAADVGQ